MSKKFIFIIFFMLFGCSKNYVYMCGDNPCKNKAEFESYFEKNLTIEISFLSKQDEQDIIDLIEYNLNKKNENILISSLPEKSKTQKKQVKKEIVKIEEKKSEDQIKNTQVPKKDVVNKQTRQVDKINIEQAILKCKIIETCKIEEIYAVILEKNKNKKYPNLTN